MQDAAELDPRTDLEIFHNLGQMHALRVFAFYERKADDYRFYMARAIEGEAELAARLVSRRGDLGPWERLPIGVGVSNPGAWKIRLERCYDETVAYFRPESRPTVVGARIGAAALWAMADWAPTDVAWPDSVVHQQQAAGELYRGLSAMTLRSEAIALREAIDSGDRLLSATFVVECDQYLAGVPERMWSHWADFYLEDDRSKVLAIDLMDAKRGLKAMADGESTGPTAFRTLAPEVIREHLTWRGAVANRADGRLPGASPDFDHRIGMVRGGGFSEALLATGTDRRALNGPPMHGGSLLD